MNELQIFIAILIGWVLSGGVGIWCTLFTYRKVYYDEKKADLFKTKEFELLLQTIMIFLPILVLGGLFVILSLYTEYPKDFRFYFRIPDEEE